MKYIEPIESESEYQELVKLGKELGIPVPQGFLEIEVTLPDKQVLTSIRKRCHSWVRNGYNLAFCQAAGKDASDSTFGAGKLSLKNTAGTLIYGAGPIIIGTGSGNAGSFGANSIEAIGSGYRGATFTDTLGIVVGTTGGDNFEAIALANRVVGGNGVGQLSYIQSLIHSPSYNAGTKTFTDTLSRFFNNNSGGVISIAEVGIYGLGGPKTGPSTSWPIYMVCRDVISPAVDVPDTAQLRINYITSLVYPS